MSKLTALAATLVFASATAFALPAAAQQHDRGNDRHEWSGDRDRDHDRDDRRDHDRDDRRHDDRRYGDNNRYNNGRRDDNRYDRRYDHRDGGYQPRYNPPRVVYRPAYVYAPPRGYAVQRWRVGSRMPPPFYVSQYYVDPYAYQLRIPPRGYHWVRVDRDVYLVQAMSGIIADVLYGVFR